MDEPSVRVKMSPKDFFLYLGIAASLYISAGSLLALLFAVINIKFPDAAIDYGYYYQPTALEALRFPLSALVVMFPLYVFLSWYVRKDMQREPAKLQLWIRRWFIWLTLFVAGATITGDIIALLNTFLGGELTIRFILKMLAVLLVADAVFGYYFYDLRRSAQGDTRVNKAIMIWAVVGVLASIVLGFLAIGSPATQRSLRFDNQRVMHLEQVQWEIINFWQTKEKLPVALSELQNDITGFRVPVDPETAASYEYSTKGPRAFELCATFDLPTEKPQQNGGTTDITKPYPYIDSNWDHEAGRTCFERTIDPDRYPPFPKERF